MQTNSKTLRAATRSSPISGILKFDNGPKVALHVETDNGAILSSRLSLADVFTCTGATPKILEWLSGYLRGKKTLIPLSLSGTLFQKQVLQTLQAIPFGQTISYKDLAALCNHPGAARAIGNACNRNPFPLFIPCHRVIHSNGNIGGFAVDLEIKRRLLEFERAARSAISAVHGRVSRAICQVRQGTCRPIPERRISFVKEGVSSLDISG